MNGRDWAPELSCEIWYENMWHASHVSLPLQPAHPCKLCLRSPDQVASGAIRALSSRLCPIMSVLCEYQHLIYNPSAAEPDCGPDTNTRTTLRETDTGGESWHLDRHFNEINNEKSREFHQIYGKSNKMNDWIMISGRTPRSVSLCKC